MRATVLGLAALALAGCGGAGGDKPIAVSGRVTFEGQPVTEGLVQFNDEKTGRGAEVTLGADGAYTAKLSAGTYAVVVVPPIVESDPKAGPANPTFKKVKNIPTKYHSAATSGLTATVGPDTTTHDFALKP